MTKQDNSTTSLPFRYFFINSYILPGFLFLLIVIIISFTFRDQLHEWTLFRSESFVSFMEQGKIIEYLNKDSAFSIELLIIALILFMSLILGNAISIIGTFFFEILWMQKGIGYPYERILSLFPETYTRRAIHITIFHFLNIMTLLYIFDIIPTKVLLRVVGSITIFYLFIRELYIKKILFRTYFNDMKIKVHLKTLSKSRKDRIYATPFLFIKLYKLKVGDLKLKHYLIYILTAVWIDVSVYIVTIFGKFFGLTRGLNKTARKRFNQNFKERFDVQKVSANSNIYWFVYTYLSEKNPESIRIANSHLRRSILLRNLSAAGLMLLITMIFLRPEIGTDNYFRWKSWVLICYVSSHLLFLGYNHIYHKYYTKFLIRNFITFKE